MKKSLFLLLPFTLFAQELAKTNADPNPLDRFGTKASYNAYFTGEAVWFKPLNQEVTKVTPTSSAFFDNNFQLGLRLTFGVNTNYDGWDTYASYTALRYSHTNPGLIDSQNGSFDTTIKLNYDVNLADFDLGRMFKVSKKLSLRPHLGVRAFWLTQKEKLSLALLSQNYKKKINSTLVGLEGGIDTLWKFSKGFSLFGNLALASLVNTQKTSHSDASYTYQRNPSTFIIPALDFSLGLRWDINFSNDMYHFAFLACYEQHIYFNINQNSALLQNSSNLSLYKLLESPDFALQGLSVGIRFDF